MNTIERKVEKDLFRLKAKQNEADYYRRLEQRYEFILTNAKDKKRKDEILKKLLAANSESRKVLDKYFEAINSLDEEERKIVNYKFLLGCHSNVAVGMKVHMSQSTVKRRLDIIYKTIAEYIEKRAGK